MLCPSPPCFGRGLPGVYTGGLTGEDTTVSAFLREYVNRRENCIDFTRLSHKKARAIVSCICTLWESGGTWGIRRTGALRSVPEGAQEPLLLCQQLLPALFKIHNDLHERRSVDRLGCLGSDAKLIAVDSPRRL